jgi:hypothetical protein
MNGGLHVDRDFGPGALIEVLLGRIPLAPPVTRILFRISFIGLSLRNVRGSYLPRTNGAHNVHGGLPAVSLNRVRPGAVARKSSALGDETLRLLRRPGRVGPDERRPGPPSTRDPTAREPARCLRLTPGHAKSSSRRGHDSGRLGLRIDGRSGRHGRRGLWGPSRS